MFHGLIDLSTISTQIPIPQTRVLRSAALSTNESPEIINFASDLPEIRVWRIKIKLCFEEVIQPMVLGKSSRALGGQERKGRGMTLMEPVWACDRLCGDAERYIYIYI